MLSEKPSRLYMRDSLYQAPVGMGVPIGGVRRAAPGAPEGNNEEAFFTRRNNSFAHGVRLGNRGYPLDHVGVVFRY